MLRLSISMVEHTVCELEGEADGRSLVLRIGRLHFEIVLAWFGR